MCNLSDLIEERSIQKLKTKDRIEDRIEGLKALIATLKPFIPREVIIEYFHA